MSYQVCQECAHVYQAHTHLCQEPPCVQVLVAVSSATRETQDPENERENVQMVPE